MVVAGEERLGDGMDGAVRVAVRRGHSGGRMRMTLLQLTVSKSTGLLSAIEVGCVLLLKVRFLEGEGETKRRKIKTG